MCIKIAVRMAVDRIDQWILSHIVGGSVFKKDMEIELNRAFKLIDETIIDKKKHNPQAPSPADVIAESRVSLNLIILLLQKIKKKFKNILSSFRI